jgi:hypothetical protein
VRNLLRPRFALLSALCLALAACAGPVSTTRVDPRAVLRDLGRSAITTGGPSLSTRNVLFERGLFEAFDKDPAAAIVALHRTMVASRGNPDLLFALAELSFLHCQAATKPDYCLAATVYAYAFLFPENSGGTAPGRFDPRLRTAADLYNWALTVSFASDDGSEVVLRGDLARNRDVLVAGTVVPSAVDNMSPRSHFIEALQEIPVAPAVTVNSIIAVDGDGPVAQGNDGVVQYSSAHIEPVESEFVVQPSSHSTQGNPHTIEEVRRILRLHVGLKTGTVAPEAR